MALMAVINNVTKSNAFYCEVTQGEELPDKSIAPGPISDLRFEFTFTYEGSAVGLKPKLNCYTSYKKHLGESYEKIGDYTPTAATVDPTAAPTVQQQQDRNTLTSLSKTQFKDAFEGYGEFLINQMKGKDTDALQPDKFGAFIAKEGIVFTNNNDRFGKPFHCFPQHRPGSTVSVDLTGRQLMDFVNIMKFRERGMNVMTVNASIVQSDLKSIQRLYGQYRKEDWFRMLTNKTQRQKLKEIFAALPEIVEQLKERESQLKRQQAPPKAPKSQLTQSSDNAVEDFFGSDLFG